MSLQMDSNMPPKLTTSSAAPHSARRHGRWLIWGLASLNLLLGLGVALRMHAPTAFADVPGMQNGDYLVITGRNNNSVTIYALELNGLKLMAFKQDALTNRSALAATAEVGQDLNRGFAQAH